MARRRPSRGRGQQTSSLPRPPPPGCGANVRSRCLTRLLLSRRSSCGCSCSCGSSTRSPTLAAATAAAVLYAAATVVILGLTLNTRCAALASPFGRAAVAGRARARRSMLPGIRRPAWCVRARGAVLTSERARLSRPSGQLAARAAQLAAATCIASFQQRCPSPMRAPKHARCMPLPQTTLHSSMPCARLRASSSTPCPCRRPPLVPTGPGS